MDEANSLHLDWRLCYIYKRLNQFINQNKQKSADYVTPAVMTWENQKISQSLSIWNNCFNKG